MSEMRQRRDRSRDRTRNRNRDDDRKVRSRPESHCRSRSRQRSDRRIRPRTDSRERRSIRPRSSERSRHRSRSPRNDRHRSSRLPRSRSRSPQSRPHPQRSRTALPDQTASFQQTLPTSTGDQPPTEKQKPNFATTGLLAKEANTVVGTNTVLKYHEPAEARKPPEHEQWRLYIWAKDPDPIDEVPLYTRSCWLLGRDAAVVDLEVESERASKQHAVIQFRYSARKNEYGDIIDRVKPYLIDLDSLNGTELNGKRVESSRYYELRNGDSLKLAEGEHEYAMFLPPAELIG